ncbi:MAG: TetR family transcriptional regulator [Actinomycetaceae bacterium]|nr:TetR family transcriptional regulator [Actinomycetaceae bacterium]
MFPYDVVTPPGSARREPDTTAQAPGSGAQRPSGTPRSPSETRQSPHGQAVPPTYTKRPTTPELLGRILKEQLRTIPLSKVTVAGLAADAGISRQAFYYHFSGIHDLAVWVFQIEIADHIMAHASYAQWANGFRQMLAYMQAHRDQAYAVINSLSHEGLEQFFFRTLREMMSVIVAELEGDLQLTEASRTFVIEHFTLIVLGHLLHWFATDMAANPTGLVDDLELILHGTVRAALERFAQRDAM